MVSMWGACQFSRDFPNRNRNPNRNQLIRFFWYYTSKHAEHSNAEPRAISKNRQRSGAVYFPLPSAIFNGIEIDALSNLPALLRKAIAGGLIVNGQSSGDRFQ